MSLARIIDQLTLIAPRHERELCAGQARNRALSPFRDALHLLDVVRSGRLSQEARVQVVLALLDEYQGRPGKRPHILWQVLLTAVFKPMLLGLRRRLAPVRDEDLDQSVLVAFFEALEAMPPAASLGYPWIALRRATTRKLFARVRPRTLADAAQAADAELTDGPPPSIDPHHASIVDALVDTHIQQQL